jgi:hypothetical protein
LLPPWQAWPETPGGVRPVLTSCPGDCTMKSCACFSPLLLTFFLQSKLLTGSGAVTWPKGQFTDRVTSARNASPRCSKFSNWS